MEDICAAPRSRIERDGRMARHAGYALRQRMRKWLKETFGRVKTVAGQERTEFRGRERVGRAFTFAAAVANWRGYRSC